MTARRPKRENRIAVPLPGVPMKGGGATQPTDAGATIRPFLSSGGSLYFVGLEQFTIGGFDPISRGTQLLSHVYVGVGQMGFVKQLRVGPYMPSILDDPWQTSGIGNFTASWRYLERAELPGSTFPFASGAWRTPMGWENYWTDDSEVHPSWRWSVRLMQGDIFKLRAQMDNVPPFDPLNPLSFYLVPDIPVPTDDAYPQGLPGDAAGPTFSSQRMQHLPEAPLETHLVVQPDTTILLFAQWEQDIIDPSVDPGVLTTGLWNGNIIDYAGNAGPTLQFPIMPSYGELHGYVQAISAKSNAALDNVELGWG